MVDSGASNSCASVLIATLTTVTSRMDMIAPSTTTEATSITPRSRAVSEARAGVETGGAAIPRPGYCRFGVDTEQELLIADETAPDGPIVLALSGELDVNSATDLRAAVLERSGDAPGGLVVDLSGVAFLDSSAVGTLLDAAAAVRAKGGGFAVVVGERTQSRSRLDLTGTSRV